METKTVKTDMYIHFIYIHSNIANDTIETYWIGDLLVARVEAGVRMEPVALRNN